MDADISRYLSRYGGKQLTYLESYLLRRVLYNKRTAFIYKTFAFFNYYREHYHLLKHSKLRKESNFSFIEIIIANRILKEHPEIINNCPKCNRLARTPKAKQCRHCFYTWDS